MDCLYEVAGICFAKPENPQLLEIFGFSEFVTALALLIIVYTTSNAVYKFRLSIARFSFLKFGLPVIILIGLSLLFMEVWLSEQWIMPVSPISPVVWQGIFGILFSATIFYWILVAYVRPPIFNINNNFEYCIGLENSILKGNQDEISEIVNEVSRSANTIVSGYSKGSRSGAIPSKYKIFGYIQRRNQKKLEKMANNAGYVIQLLGNELVCNKIISHSPITAVRVCEECIQQKCFHLPISQFLFNLSTEAIRNKNSLLYLEEHAHYSGVLGYKKRLSTAIYGSYGLIRSCQPGPLDLDYKFRDRLDVEQFEVFKRAVLIAFRDFVHSGESLQAYPVFSRVLHDWCHFRINQESQDSYDLYDRDSWRFHTIVSMFEEMIQALSSDQNVEKVKLRKGERQDNSIYDGLAEAGFNALFTASQFEGEIDSTWGIYLDTWDSFFSRFSTDDKARAIVTHKLRRLIFDEVKRMDRFINYKGARIIGLCMNIIGFPNFEMLKERDSKNSEYILGKVIVRWLRKNYLKVLEDNNDVAESFLLGSISFDSENQRLVKTYSKGLNKTAPKEYLQLYREISDNSSSNV
jgi:hypothetical protein